jgi:hypothetical protein
MFLHFPTPDRLLLALTSGAIPAETAAAPVKAAWDDAGGLFVQLAGRGDRALREKLQQLGIESSTSCKLPFAPYMNWLQLLPLARREPQLADKSAVLFDIATGEQLAEVIAEMLRLGNDRQSFRHLANGHAGRTLLRVLGPPYYTLLRSLEGPAERDGHEAAESAQPALLAFAEQRPRVWVELGYQHPLAERIAPPAGKWLLVRAPRQWELLDEGAFHDIYQALEFALPAAETDWRDSALASRLTVPLRLASMAETDPAELWVLKEDALAQVEALVAHSDNELVARLAFAVVEQEGKPGQPLVVLRVRPSKLPPPVLVLRALACRNYLRVQNLFLPVGRRLHPPLRRDVVAKLLAADANQIVWLQPQEGGQFQPRSVADTAFRPLSEWVDYVLDCQHEALAAWIESHRFEFAAFVSDDDAAPRPRPPGRERREREPQPQRPEAGASPPTEAKDDDTIVAEVVEAPRLEVAAEEEQRTAQPGELQQRLTRVERQFLELEVPLDAPERLPLWREMARLNGGLARRQDASLCWSHVLWEQQLSVGDSAAWLAELAPAAADFPTAEELQQQLDQLPARQDVMRLAVQLVRLRQQQLAQPGPGGDSQLPSEVAQNLPLAARVLAQHEGLLPIRLAWLAWSALAWLTHRDALALARARDRLLERLFHQGLTAEHDLPGFLRAGSGADSDRQRILRERLGELRETIADWIPTKETRAYADLIFAYGFARLGESAVAQSLATAARQQLNQRDAIHGWATQAYEFRIAEATAGTRGAQLPRELVAQREQLEKTDRYKADRLREHSRLIEPYKRIETFRLWHGHFFDELARDLALLFDLTDRDELLRRLGSLFSQPPPAAATPRGRVRLLTAALELSPRLGEQFAAGLIGEVLPAWSATDDVVERALLLEKALQVAAHFDERDAVQAFVERFEQSLTEIVAVYLQLPTSHPDTKGKLLTIESLFQQSLRGLRKLGLRDEIGRIFTRLVGLVQQATPAAAERQRTPKVRAKEALRSSKLLLSVAGSWYYFGQSELAQPVVDEVRRLLAQEELVPVDQSSLACAYLSAVGQAPLETALRLVRGLFAIDAASGSAAIAPIPDTFTTSTHFALAQLDLIETTVLTLVSDDLALSPETRRWLEEDEFLVRRRIHQDVRELVEGAGN